MYIAPNSIVQLLTKVPLRNSYEDTVMFESADAQLSYFNSRTTKVLNAQSYARTQNGVLTIQATMREMAEVNYLMFKNTSFENKWFYAFVTRIDYINNDVCNIYFELDVMQTYLFNITPQYCYIERQHTRTDEIGEHLLPEPISIGDYQCDGYTDLSYEQQKEKCIYLWRSAEDLSSQHGSGMIGGLYNGVRYWVYNFDEAGAGAISDYIEQIIAADKIDSIVSINMAPRWLQTASLDEPAMLNDEMEPPSRFGGYTPKNNKLLTYPYCFCTLDCGNDSKNYRYERFIDRRVRFRIFGTPSPDPEIIAVPLGYDGAAYGGGPSYTEEVIMSGFPQCAFPVDTYMAWLAQKSSGAFIDAAGTVIGGAMAASAGNVAGVIGAGLSLASQANSAIIEATKGSRVRGNIGSSTQVGDNSKQFTFKYMRISEDAARSVDSFFSRYGYRRDCIELMNRNSRPHWNYVKTQNVHLTGEVPAQYMRQIEQIYDKGITFWKRPLEVGNYELDNRPGA